MQRILLLDNYDSFTYNLSHYIVGEGARVDVLLNDEIDCSTLDVYDKVVLSPGPGLPKDSGKLMEVIQKSVGIRPILGVCLGMQGIVEHLGGELYNQSTVKHGVSEIINLQESQLFTGLETEIEVGLYHSWAVKETGDFDIVASSRNNIVMAIQNEEKALYGVQFHPESILTPNGKEIIRNFLQL